MAELEVAIFAPVSTSEAASDAVRSVLNRSRPLVKSMRVTIKSYRAPAHLLGNTLVMCEYRSPGRRPMTAAACGYNIESLLVRFCGELTERISLSRFRPQVYRTATEEQLRTEGLNIFDTTGYLGAALFPDKWRFSPYSRDDVVDWTIAEDLESPATPMYVPIQLCQSRITRSQAWCELTSVGTAAGPTIKYATEHAVREIFERDALRTAWFTFLTLGQTSPPVSWNDMRERDVEAGWKTTFFCGATRIGVPLWVVHTLHPALHLTAIGSSCTPCPEEGLNHALDEALQGRLYTWLTRNDRDLGAGVHTFLDHASYYSNPQRFTQAGRLFAVNIEHDVNNNNTGADWGHETLSGAARLTLYVDANTSVVRVLHPRAQPVEADHDAARLVGQMRTLSRNSLRTTPTPFV